MTGTIQVSMDAGATYNDTAIISGVAGGKRRLGVSIPANQANGSTSTRIRDTIDDGVIGIDCIQIEANSYPTTYIDGDQVDPNVPGGYRWTGVAHGSTSTRSAQVRSGGRENVLDATYSVNIDTNGGTGQGVAPLENITQEYALQPGGEFQEVKIKPRVLTLKCRIPSTSLANLHSKRKAFWNVIKPDLVAPTQPFVLVYNSAQAGAAKKVYASFYYESGLDVTGDELALLDSFDLRLVAVDPFWYEDMQEQTTLTNQATLASDYARGRINGTWQRFGSGFNDTVYCVAIDYQRNRIFFGGKFTTANGVTVNGICYWDGTTFQPLGAGTKGIGAAGTGTVFAIAIAPNGDIWAGGNFTTAGGSGTKGLAKWAAVGTSAPSVWASSTTFVQITGIVIDKNYRIYISGNFTGYMTLGATYSYFIYTNDQGANWVAPTATIASGGTTTWVYKLALDIDGLGVYLVGDYTAIAGVANTSRIAKYSASNFTALSTGVNSDINDIALNPAGDVYIVGSFTTPENYFAKWNGSLWQQVAYTSQGDVGSPSAVLSIGWDYVNNLLLFITNTNFTLQSNNGSIASNYDLTLSAVSSAGAIVCNRLNGDIYFAGNTAATATESGITAVTITSTAITYPVIIINATTTAASSTTLKWIENQSTGQRLYVSALALQTGETLTIDLRPGKKIFNSNWRGNLTAYVLSNSDFSNFKLLPGANTIALYLTGTLTGATAIIQNVPQHLSVDGAAA